jgi:hypothetical protein
MTLDQKRNLEKEMVKTVETVETVKTVKEMEEMVMVMDQRNVPQEDLNHQDFSVD